MHTSSGCSLLRSCCTFEFDHKAQGTPTKGVGNRFNSLWKRKRNLCTLWVGTSWPLTTLALLWSSELCSFQARVRFWKFLMKWGCSSAVQCLPSKYEALGSISIAKERGKKGEEMKNMQCYLFMRDALSSSSSVFVVLNKRQFLGSPLILILSCIKQSIWTEWLQRPLQLSVRASG